MRTWIYAGLLSLSCSAFAETGLRPESEAVQGRLEQIKEYDLEKLQEVAFGGVSFQSIPLTDVIPGHDPKLWVSDYVYREFYRALWMASGLISTQGSGVPSVDDFVERISRDTAVSHLGKIAAFAALCKLGDSRIWVYLESQASKEATLLDMCFAGKIVWGDKVPVLPKGAHTRFSLDDSLPAAESWVLPQGSSESWSKLYNGSNAIYRLLALEGMSLWAEQSDRRELLRKTASDDYAAMSYAWRKQVRQLPENDRIELCEEALAQVQQAPIGNAVAGELRNENIDRLSELLDDARSTKAKLDRAKRERQGQPLNDK